MNRASTIWLAVLLGFLCLWYSLSDRAAKAPPELSDPSALPSHWEESTR